MDPNANLQEQAAILTERPTPAAYRRLRELRIALQAWIAGGGFPPNWDAYPIARVMYQSWESGS